MIWGKDDTFGRWVQGICALVLFAFGAFLGYLQILAYRDPYGYHSNRGTAGYGAIGCTVLGVRCLWYAVTGKDNINRDEFD